ncbi:hypothetical protein CRUP_011265 [Coryphaenoides rupestris]|nr:hypothetical protein CRUP_011265 [Coryphaenoides rupestris]
MAAPIRAGMTTFYPDPVRRRRRRNICNGQTPHISRDLGTGRDSRSVSTSPSRTGPFTFLMIERLLSSMNSTRT